MNYTEFKVDRLRELARSLMISDADKLKKKELLSAIEAIIGPSTDSQEKKPDKEPQPQPHNEPMVETEKEPEEPQLIIPARVLNIMKASEVAGFAKEAWEPQSSFGLSPQRFVEICDGREYTGIFDKQPDNNYGFIRCGETPGECDIYVHPVQLRHYNLRTGDKIICGTRIKNAKDNNAGLLYIREVNGYPLEKTINRPEFEKMTPVYPDKKLKLEASGCPLPMRIVDLISPIGRGQRGMIVSQPKAGKTTFLKQIARAIASANPDINIMVLLIDERPEEVTDITESIAAPNVTVIASTFDEQPEHHKKVAEKAIEAAKRRVEYGEDVVILLDSLTRLGRAYNLTVTPSGRTLSGGLDPAALYVPKKFFGAARNMRQGGSLTILATALVDTGSRMDDVIFEEFKGTGNMELVLDRRLSEKRVFPAIDIAKSGTRNEELLLTKEELEACEIIRKALGGVKGDEAAERLIDLFGKSRTNAELVDYIRKTRYV